MKTKVVTSAALLAVLGGVRSHLASSEDLERMISSTFLNEESVAAAVGFVDLPGTPYGSEPYNVNIDETENCFVVFADAERTSYDLVTSVDPPVGNFGVFLSHETPCGVCSNLQDLAVYIKTPDLTNPVRACSLRFSPAEQIACIRELGFSDKCSTIWAQNAAFTRSKCLVPCLLSIFSPNNQPFGTVNPCDPAELQCGNTINDAPACLDFQFLNNEFRLNPCLQCDECHSGPMFQKIAGRTRRGSGIESGINRPDLPIIEHSYFVESECT